VIPADSFPFALLQALACAVGGRATGTPVETNKHITDTEN
jgi:hypothetical protein